MVNNTFWHYAFLNHCLCSNKPKQTISKTPEKFDLRKYLYLFVVFLVSLLVLYSLQHTELSNTLLRSFGSFWWSFANKVTTWTYTFVSFVVKISTIIIISISRTKGRQNRISINLSFSSTSWLTNGISSDLQKLLRYFQSAICHVRIVRNVY